MSCSRPVQSITNASAQAPMTLLLRCPLVTLRRRCRSSLSLCCCRIHTARGGHGGGTSGHRLRCAESLSDEHGRLNRYAGGPGGGRPRQRSNGAPSSTAPSVAASVALPSCVIGSQAREEHGEQFLAYSFPSTRLSPRHRPEHSVLESADKRRRRSKVVRDEVTVRDHRRRKY